jgi:hypothetical protein
MRLLVVDSDATPAVTARIGAEARAAAMPDASARRHGTGRPAPRPARYQATTRR